ncbi:hypothetical protein DMX12_27995 [Pseudomonas sp. MB-090624]|nr:hypothetical protein DMX12_27995 [Pseudomonas sp. MB-090624]
MMGKVIELKPAARRKESTAPARSSLADAILQQFLAEADGPTRYTHVPAQILEFSEEGKGRALRIISQVQMRLALPFTLAFWLKELIGPVNPTS